MLKIRGEKIHEENDKKKKYRRKPVFHISFSLYRK